MLRAWLRKLQRGVMLVFNSNRIELSCFHSSGYPHCRMYYQFGWKV
jgi:hypothetical protein